MTDFPTAHEANFNLAVFPHQAAAMVALGRGLGGFGFFPVVAAVVDQLFATRDIDVHGNLKPLISEARLENNGFFSLG